MDFSKVSIKNTFVLWLLLMLNIEWLLSFFYEIFDFFGISYDRKKVPTKSTMSLIFWQEIVRKNNNKEIHRYRFIDHTKTAPWNNVRIQPYRHPPTRMELDRKYRNINDIKLTGIDAYMNRDKNISDRTNEVETIRLGD